MCVCVYVCVHVCVCLARVFARARVSTCALCDLSAVCARV